MSVAWRSREEGQLVLADLQLVAVVERARLDAPAVEEGAVQAPLVLDEELPVAAHDQRVATRDRDVVEEDVAVGRAANGGLLLLEQEVLARAAATGAHDQRRPLGLDLVE